MHCGYYDDTYRVARTLFRIKALLTDLNYTACTPKEIKAAKFRMKEATGTEEQTIKLYQYIGSASWTESGATWANVAQNEDEDDYVASASADNNAATIFDITNMLKDWKKNPSRINQGFILKCVNETVDKAFYSSEYSDIMSRPYVEITYYDLLPTSGDELEYRPDLWDGLVEPVCNCYSYILNNQTHPDYADNYLWFRQQPGDYARIISRDLTSKEGMLAAVLADDMLYKGASSPQLFREVDEYETCPEGMYKVALLVHFGELDYHWVRQDKDGFWSHKNGNDPASEVDDANNLIYNPKYAYWENYYFVAFYAVCPWNNEFKSSPPDYCFTNWGQAEYCDEYNAFLANISRSRNLSLRE